MTRAERLLYRRRHLLWVAAALLFLGGAIGVAFLQIRAEAEHADRLAAEADRRGQAVTTLAGDVRTLRAQIEAKGGTPAAPDPGRAVSNLPSRTKVPVPIQGPAGPLGKTGPAGRQGDEGKEGKAGQNGEAGREGRGGNDGTPGANGQDGVEGQVGPPGADGKDGTDGADSTVPGPRGEQGERGPAGPSCPDGYSLQHPPLDPDGLMCRRSGAPGGTPEQGLLGLTAFTMSARRRR